MSKIDVNTLSELVLELAATMLGNGAEVQRVEYTMDLIPKSYGYTSDSFISSTGIFSIITLEDGTTITKFKKLKSRTIDLNKFKIANQISRDIVNQSISIEEALEKLQKLENYEYYKKSTMILSSGLTCFAFALLFGGSMGDAFSAFLVGLIMSVVAFKVKGKNLFFNNFIPSICIAVMAIVFYHLGIADNIDKVVISSIMPLVPGLTFTNAIRDLFQGDYLSGLSRMAEATIVAIAIAIAIGFALSGYVFIGGVI